MFSVESSFALKYFVFGFNNLEKTKVVIGYYHKNKKLFVVDFHGEFTKKVKEDFVNGKIKLPYVNILGVGFESFKDIIEKQYIRDKSFSVDYMNYENEFMNVNNKVVVKGENCVSLQVGLSDGLRWNTGHLYERCDVLFSYDDYFDDIQVEFKPPKNVEVVSYRDVLGVVEKVPEVVGDSKEVSKEVVLDTESVGGVTKMKNDEVKEPTVENKKVTDEEVEEDLDFDISYFSGAIRSTGSSVEEKQEENDTTMGSQEDSDVSGSAEVAEVDDEYESEVLEVNEKEEIEGVKEEGTPIVTETSEKEKVVPEKPKADNPVFEENDFSFGFIDWGEDEDDKGNKVEETKKEEVIPEKVSEDSDGTDDSDDFDLPDFDFSFDD